jgi:hypothetical protein
VQILLGISGARNCFPRNDLDAAEGERICGLMQVKRTQDRWGRFRNGGERLCRRRPRWPHTRWGQNTSGAIFRPGLSVAHPAKSDPRSPSPANVAVS